MVGLSIVLPRFASSFDLAVTAAVTVDVRASLHIEQSWSFVYQGMTSIAEYTGDTDHVVPGLAFGVAWRTGSRR